MDGQVLPSPHPPALHTPASGSAVLLRETLPGSLCLSNPVHSSGSAPITLLSGQSAHRTSSSVAVACGVGGHTQELLGAQEQLRTPFYT